MTPEQFEEVKKLIKTTVSETIQSACEDRLKLVLQKLDSIAGVLDINFANMDQDRKDFAEIKTHQATIHQLVKEMLDIISNQTNRLTKTVENKADQAIGDSAQAVADSVEPVMARVAKKMLKGVPLSSKRTKKHPWWQFWKG
jgi:thymidylate synthase